MQSIGVGFSFAGVHCDDMQCELANNDESMHSFMEEFTVVSENVDGYDGSYYIGEEVKEKEFNIKLFVEEVADDVLMRIGHWMRKGAYGKLIYDHAPYKYYNARVSAPMDLSNIYTKYNLARNMFVYSGIIGIKLTAYNPYAYLLDEVRSAYPDVGDMLNTLNANSAMMHEQERPTTTGSGNRFTILAANLGNAVAKPDIIISGRFSSGTIIRNNTTGQQMIIKDDGNQERKYIISSTNGQTERIIDSSGGINEAADTVKTGSFITLVPAAPAQEIEYRISGGTITSSNASEDMVGKYMRINNTWSKITSVSGTTIRLENSVSGSQSGKTRILRMNEISVEAGGNDTVTQMTLEYRDTFY